MAKHEALAALDSLYRFFDVLTADQRKERDRLVRIIRVELCKVNAPKV